jgi:hypothetical protein
MTPLVGNCGNRVRSHLIGHHRRQSPSDVKEGNIIFDFAFRSTEKIVHADMEELYAVGSDPRPLVKALQAANAEGLQILELNSSYGAHGLVLFHTWSLSQREVQP